MKRKASELIFISRIKSDGSCVEPITKDYDKILELEFELHRLSHTEGTWIAFCMFAYVVKLK